MEKKYGVNEKKRFALKYPDGEIKRFGTCDPNDDDRVDIKMMFENYYLAKYNKDSYEDLEISLTLLPIGTLIANGFYDKELSEFNDLKTWIDA